MSVYFMIEDRFTLQRDSFSSCKFMTMLVSKLGL